MEKNAGERASKVEKYNGKKDQWKAEKLRRKRIWKRNLELSSWDSNVGGERVSQGLAPPEKNKDSHILSICFP